MVIICCKNGTATGSRIAYEGCYDRNDNPKEYCEHYAKDEERNRDGWACDNLLQ